MKVEKERKDNKSRERVKKKSRQNSRGMQPGNR